MLNTLYRTKNVLLINTHPVYIFKLTLWTNTLLQNVQLFNKHLDKVDVRAKKITMENYYDKKDDPPRRECNPKCVCAKQQTSKTHEAKVDLKGKIRISTTIVGDFNTHFPVINRTTRQKNEQGYKRTEQDHQPIRSNWNL